MTRAAILAFLLLSPCLAAAQVRPVPGTGNPHIQSVDYRPDQVVWLEAAHLHGDMFDAVLAFLDQSGDRMETVYKLEKRDGFGNTADRDVRALVYERTAAGAAMLRDMLCRAWAESAVPPAKVVPSPIDSSNPRFNPETGSAPA